MSEITHAAPSGVEHAKLLVFADRFDAHNVGCKPSGGARRDRTDDLMLAKHALSQLSYGPVPEDESDPSDFALRASPDTLRISLAWLRHA